MTAAIPRPPLPGERGGAAAARSPGDVAAPAAGSAARRRRAMALGEVCLLLGLTLLALLPRASNLLALDPFIDEVSWTHWALREFDPAAPSSWVAPLVRDGRPPLHFWLTVLVGRVVDNGILAGRLAAALAGAGSALALYALGRALAGRPTGLVAAVLWALAPFSVFFARVAADDAALALMAILATLGGALLARRPTARAALFAGAMVGLATLAKTTGALTAAAPPLAVLLLAPPRRWLSYARPLALAGAAALAVALPLLLFLPQLLAQLALHTGGGAAGAADGAASPLGGLARRDLLARNLDLVAYWLPLYFGWPWLGLAGAGLLAALVRRERGLLYAALLGVLWGLLLLDRSTSLFGRYLLFASFPLALLAARAIVGAGELAARLARRSLGPESRHATRADGPPDPMPVGIVPPLAAGTAGLLGLALALGPVLAFTLATMRDARTAPIPESERFRYVEQWYAAHGLGDVAAYLRDAGRDRPVTVLVPSTSREERVLVPHEALRIYLRHSPEVRFVESPVLYRGQELREVRRLVRDGPTYLLVNGSYTDAPGTPTDVPQYTRRLEASLARDVPEAREVLRIPRPSAPNWLALYRLDRH